MTAPIDTTVVPFILLIQQRPGYEELIQLAQNTRCAVLFLTHQSGFFWNWDLSNKLGRVRPVMSKDDPFANWEEIQRQAFPFTNDNENPWVISLCGSGRKYVSEQVMEFFQFTNIQPAQTLYVHTITKPKQYTPALVRFEKGAELPTIIPAMENQSDTYEFTDFGYAARLRAPCPWGRSITAAETAFWVHA